MRLLRPLLLVALAALLVPAGAAPAASCKKFRETKGCKLPNPSGFAAKGNVFTLTIGRTGGDVNGRFATRCTGGGEPEVTQEAEWPIDTRLDFGRPRVGKTYDVRSETENPPDSTGKIAKYVWTGKLKVRSAKKVSLTLTFTSTYGSTPENTRTCTGSETKTLTRVKYLR